LSRAYLLLGLATLFWSGNWIAGRALAGLVPPAALTFWRWVIALALIAPIVGPRLWAQRALLRRAWKPIVLLGLLGGGVHNILQYWGLHYTSATNGAILNSLTPALIIVLGTSSSATRSLRAAAGAAHRLAGTLALITRLDYAMLASVGPNRAIFSSSSRWSCSRPIRWACAGVRRGSTRSHSSPASRSSRSCRSGSAMRSSTRRASAS
jgi:drug/metabolite transporter (DMT)-like permease